MAFSPLNESMAQKQAAYAAIGSGGYDECAIAPPPSPRRDTAMNGVLNRVRENNRRIRDHADQMESMLVNLRGERPEKCASENDAPAIGLLGELGEALNFQARLLERMDAAVNELKGLA